ncbi:hypothetical protein J437_LFUL002706 [Ladona fulva]|uniref:Protein BCCIP homolog n=1 Tax=Ladona fulva TaxID=123851 RepID=A0A8K0JV39_LADFU|nr:hypothetical protein J437_LFUL002706 [Ladona fulva]
MAAPVKKRAIGGKDTDPLDGSDSSDSDSINEDDELGSVGQEIQVDFEGRNPIDSDFHGIKQLLQQLFLKAHVNLSELTDLIISQNYVGSVVKQSEIDEGSDDEDDDLADSNDVFGITTVINLTEKKELECIRQLRSLLLELCEEHGSEETKELVRSLVQSGGPQHNVGLLITERFINIPVQIAVPLLESLSKEIKRAQEKRMPFDFSYYILICKLYKMDAKAQRKSRKKKNDKGRPGLEDPSVIWSNPEEEVISEDADYSFEFCVKDEAGSGLGGQWEEGDAEMVPYRRVLILQSDRFEHAIGRVKAFVSEETSSRN